ncbi:MAG: carbamoyltransferase HypF [Gammaproteobacteria bacterium]|nr:carbamoyltransferase HypF [Gammaproteobacteria bacterium]
MQNLVGRWCTGVSGIARHITITGKVQGVGFRPFIYRLAHQLDLHGSVRNCTGQVEVHIEGLESSIEQFCNEIVPAAPAISEPHIQSITNVQSESYSDFKILASELSDTPKIHIPSDFFTCPDCLTECRTPNERRYRYPFINCTQCGPRYTIINKLPYDRPSTSMSTFPLCDDCRKEYEDPLDRRFHAQPLACPVCGPSLHFIDEDNDIEDTQQALAASIKALRDGKVIAVKGIGGYHLLCNAENDLAIKHLRQHKPRPDKPLALMFPEQGNDGLAKVRLYVDLTTDEAELLRSPARPIVLARKNKSPQTSLSGLIAPGLNEIGIMLPYSPLHYLLLDELDKPVIASSANVSGEPVLTDRAGVENRLSHVAQAFLHHNREIVRPADDPVYRTIAGKPRPLRMGRGNAPVEIKLPFTLTKPVIATGSHMKNTVALAWDNRMVISPHIGDLDSLHSQQVFAQVINDLQQLYQVNAKAVICDAHPMYASSRWAEKCGLPLTKIFHHRAHASALVLDHWNNDVIENEHWLVFTWDGVGYGEDGTLWGGEGLYGRPGHWQHATSMKPFYLPGGEKAGREPWRSAAALCWQSNIEWPGLPDAADILQQAWSKRINSPQTTSVGRLFDAAPALTGVLQTSSFEGQGPMLLEQVSNELTPQDPLPIKIDDAGVLRADWSELLPGLLEESRSPADRSAVFHSRLAHTLIAQAQSVREANGIKNIGLCGGVFQNRKLTEYVTELLQRDGFNACLPERVPPNDAGICVGQIVEYGILRV